MPLIGESAVLTAFPPDEDGKVKLLVERYRRVFITRWFHPFCISYVVSCSLRSVSRSSVEFAEGGIVFSL
jgi:hypothetical protein